MFHRIAVWGYILQMCYYSTWLHYQLNINVTNNNKNICTALCITHNIWLYILIKYKWHKWEHLVKAYIYELVSSHCEIKVIDDVFFNSILLLGKTGFRILWHFWQGFPFCLMVLHMGKFLEHIYNFYNLKIIFELRQTNYIYYYRTI